MDGQLDRSEHLREIKEDVKDIKTMLTSALIAMAKVETEVSLHKKLWGGLAGVVIGLGVFYLQKQII